MTDVARPGDVLLIPVDAPALMGSEPVEARLRRELPGIAGIVFVSGSGPILIYRQKTEPVTGLCGHVMPVAGLSTDSAPVCAWPADHPGTWHGAPGDVPGMIPMMWDSRTEPAVPLPEPDRSGEYCLFCDGDRRPEHHPGGRDQHGF